MLPCFDPSAYIGLDIVKCDPHHLAYEEQVVIQRLQLGHHGVVGGAVGTPGQVGQPVVVQLAVTVASDK